MSEELLTMQNVKLPVGADGESAVEGIDCVLSPGALLLVQCDHLSNWIGFSEVALGLLAPEAGVVTWKGNTWVGMSPDAAARERSRIGRVFRGRAWISNLDVDENITLATRHHSKRNPAEIYADAVQLAERFGWSEIPAQRPARLRLHDLQIAQWIRAFVGHPDLVLLEEPCHEVSRREGMLLAEWVGEYCGRGGAVVWMTEREETLNNTSLQPTLRAKIFGDRWEQL